MGGTTPWGLNGVKRNKEEIKLSASIIALFSDYGYNVVSCLILISPHFPNMIDYTLKL